MSDKQTFPSPNHGAYQEGQRRVWAVNTNRGGLASALVRVGRFGADLEFGDGSHRAVSLAELEELEAGREWFEKHPAPQQQGG